MNDYLQTIDILLSGQLSRDDFEGFLAQHVVITADNKKTVEALSLKYMRRICRIEPVRVTVEDSINQALEEGVDY